MRHRAFTLTEVLVGLFLVSLLFLAGAKLVREIGGQYVRGTVDLQNLQEARLAINWLRRDFSCACPKFAAGDGGALVEKTRRLPLALGSRSPPGQQTVPILFTPTSLSFYRFSFETSAADHLPPVELVLYSFDATAKTLSRTDARRTVVFEGIRGARFQVYVHESNPLVPVLWVSLQIQENAGDRAPAGPPLELTTTVSSAFVASDLNHHDWYFRTFPR